MKKYVTIYFNGGFNKQFSFDNENLISELEVWLENNDTDVYHINQDECQTMILRKNICYVDIES